MNEEFGAGEKDQLLEFYFIFMGKKSEGNMPKYRHSWSAGSGNKDLFFLILFGASQIFTMYMFYSLFSRFSNALKKVFQFSIIKFQITPHENCNKTIASFSFSDLNVLTSWLC